MELAGFGRRYLALLLDILFLEILGAVVNAFAISSLGNASQRVLVEWPGGQSSGNLLEGLTGSLILLLVMWSWYFTCFHGMAGRTPGKAILGLWVRHRDGRPLNCLEAFGRLWAGLILSFLSLGLGYSWAGWDRWRQAWHDKCFDTVVIQKSTS